MKHISINWQFQGSSFPPTPPRKLSIFRFWRTLRATFNPFCKCFVLSVLFKKSWSWSCSSNLIETSIPVCSKKFWPHNNSGVSRQFPLPSFKLNEVFSFYLFLCFIEYSQIVFKKIFWVESQSAPWTLQSLPCSAAAAINLNRPSLLTLLPYPCSSRAWQQECNREPEPGQEMAVVCHQSFPFCCFGNDCSSESRS